jgi:AraC family transcriptional regulator of adaptative response/methylated-DNA-[protein]-cysteine methyltransferase
MVNRRHAVAPARPRPIFDSSASNGVFARAGGATMRSNQPRMFAMAAALPTAADPRWPRIVARDRTADGAFYYSVATTGVYCRPSCPSRAANPANVTIHDSLADARATGARPCRRCDPDGEAAAETAALIARTCRTIETAERTPALADLAAAAGLSPGHFHRLFKAATGLTPRGYAAAHRADRVRAELREGGTVTQAIYAAGFGSNGRFYAASPALLGMTPSRYRAGGARETLRFAIGQSKLGAILVASSDAGVAAILLGDDPAELLRDLQDRFPAATLIGGDAEYEALVARVIGFVEAPATGLDLPLDIRGTAFQQRVWQALRAIPPGRTASYTEIACAVGAPNAVRAVAGACAANAHAVAIPCHRVVRRDGDLSGYRWGVARKRQLIEAEAGDAA